MKIFLALCAFGVLQCVRAQSGETPSNDINSAKLYYFYGDNYFTDRQIYDLSNATQILSNTHFQSDKTTAIYIHGWLEASNVTSVINTTQAYLVNGNYNIVVLDWGELAAGAYTTAVENVIVVGNRMAQVVMNLYNFGLSLSKLHIVGHSLGAQIAGIIGKRLQTISENALKLDHVTGLDPAGPLFYTLLGLVPLLVPGLDPSVATFVDVIHTDAGYLGVPDACGHTDFWPNAGTRFQPNCPVVSSFLNFDDQKCSHSRSWQLWSASLILAADETAFLSTQSDSWATYLDGTNNGKQTIQMGINCPRGYSGNWFLQTDVVSQYSDDALEVNTVDNSGLVVLVANLVTQLLHTVIGILL